MGRVETVLATRARDNAIVTTIFFAMLVTKITKFSLPFLPIDRCGLACGSLTSITNPIGSERNRLFLAVSRMLIFGGGIRALIRNPAFLTKFNILRKTIFSFQIIQVKFAEMITEITKAQLVALQLARLKESGRIRPAHISLAKRNNVYHALEIARMAREIMGANGISLEYPVMRHMCNLETVKTYEGTHDIHSLTLGREVTGISAFV